MLIEAAKYASTIPKLEWIYIGQYPVAMNEVSTEKGRQALPLSSSRDGYNTLLNQIFGWKRMST